MKTCFLCEKEYPTKDVRSWYSLLQHICIKCSAKYRCLKLAIFCTDTISSLIPLPGAIKCRVTGFVKNAKGGTDYRKPILKSFEDDHGIGTGASSETEKAVPSEHCTSQEYSMLASDSSAGLFDEAPPLSDTRYPLSNTGTNTPNSRNEITPFRTGLPRAHRHAWEANDRLCRTADNLCRADDRPQGEDRVCQEEDKVCQAEERVRQAEERVRQAEERVRQAKESLRHAEDRSRQAEERLRQAKESLRQAEDRLRLA